MTSPFLAPGRDDATAMGRGARSGETYLSLPGVSLASGTTFAAASDTDYYRAIYVDSPIVVDQLVCEVSTGSAGNMRLGLYRADRSWQPIGAPLVDTGNLDTTSPATLTYTIGTPVYLARGRYLTIYNCSATPTLRAHRGDVPGMMHIDSTLGNGALLSDVQVGRSYAAFPTPGTAWTTQGNASANPPNHIVYLRISAP